MNTHSSHRNINTEGKSIFNDQKPKGFLLLGNSHVRRLGEKKLLGNSIKEVEIGGIQSARAISRHRGTINSDLPETKKVIIHISCNDAAKRRYKIRIELELNSGRNRTHLRCVMPPRNKIFFL